MLILMLRLNLVYLLTKWACRFHILLVPTLESSAEHPCEQHTEQRAKNTDKERDLPLLLTGFIELLLLDGNDLMLESSDFFVMSLTLLKRE